MDDVSDGKSKDEHKTMNESSLGETIRHESLALVRTRKGTSGTVNSLFGTSGTINSILGIETIGTFK